MMRRFALITPVVSVLALSLAAQAPAQDSVVLERDPQPKLFVTDFPWYEPNTNENGKTRQKSLACTRAVPRRAMGEITSTDYLSSDGYFGGKYKRFKSRGVDGIAFVVTDRIPDSFAGGNALATAALAAEADLDFFAYYDLFINTAKTSRMTLCLPGSTCPLTPGQQRIPRYNINTRPQIYDQLLEDFSNIAEHMIVPHMDEEPGRGGYLMLEDANGNRVLDENGLPRPILAIYIARTFADAAGNIKRLGELMDEVTAVWNGFGLGRPAMVLDVLFWVTPSEDPIDVAYDPQIVDAFGDYAVAITWYSFFDTFQGGLRAITNDGPRPPMSVWGKHLNQHYHQTRDEMVANGHNLMLWPGVSTQIDTRTAENPGCRPRGVNVVYHLRDAEDWRTMLTRGLVNASRPVIDGEAPLQSLVIVANAGEWFEIGGLDYTPPNPRGGGCTFPFNWCEALLDVVEEEDLFP